jgi:competence protein ComEC
MIEPPEDKEVIRPALPVLLSPLAGIWAGLYVAEALSWKGALLLWPLTLVILALSAAALLFVLLKHVPGPKKAILSLAASVFVGLSVGMLYWGGVDKGATSLAEGSSAGGEQRYSMSVIEDAREGLFSQTSLAVIHIPGSQDLRVRVYWDAKQEALPLGMDFTASVDFKPLTQQQAFLHQKGLCGSVSLSDVQQDGFSNNLIGCVYSFRESNRLLLSAKEGQGAALLRGILLGDTTDLDHSEAGRAYKATGLSHLIAVSGSHLVVIAVVLSWFWEKLKIGRVPKILMITALLIAYVFLTGLQPSAIRACVMTLIVSIAPLIRRRGHVPSALAVAGASMMLVFPPAAFSVGFWLSMFAVFGLTIFCPLITAHLLQLVPKVRNYRLNHILWSVRKAVVEPFSLTVTAQLATVAITAPLFSTLSVVSPLANLLVTPFVTIIVGAGIVLLCILPLLGPIGLPLIDLLAKVAELTINIAEFCSTIPYACIPVAGDLRISVSVYLCVAALVYLIWPKPSKRRSLGALLSVLLLSALLITGSFLPARPQIVMLDVGQGDAILIRDGSANVLIDTGRSDGMLLKALARQRVSHLDAVIITHLDDDHYGAMGVLKGVISVDHVYFAAGLLEAKQDSEAVSMARSLLSPDTPETLVLGDTLDLASCISLEVIWPEGAVSAGDNKDSICFNLSFDADHDGQPEYLVLLTGDAESPEIEVVLNTPGNEHFDVFKVGHHGSRKSVTEAQVEKMGCTMALISVGMNNRYGHPAPEILAYLENSGVIIYRTDLNGDIVVLFEARRLIVRCDTMGTALN